MIKQIDSNSSLKEKKYKILSYSILLGNTEDIDKDKKELEETAKYLDAINESSYEEKLASKDYTTTTLEEEKDRLNSLIECINDRVKEREEFNSMYYQVMHSYLDDLPDIKGIDSLDYYKKRFKNINEYLTNIEDIKLTEEELDIARGELKVKKIDESNAKGINKKLESTLLEEFTKVIADNEYYVKLNYVDIDGELNNIENDIIEKKNTLDTFMASYEALEKSGISSSERDEYRSYVTDVEHDYYASAEKKYLLNIYKLVLDTCEEYDAIFTKRSRINDILYERNNLRKKLHILDEDELKEFVDTFEEQFAIIQSQKHVLDDINQLMLDVSKLDNKLEDLKNRNSREEIVDIIQEFRIDKYNDSTVNVNSDKEPNIIVDINDAYKMNIDDVRNTAHVVMKKVVMAIEPKKFTRKKTAKELKDGVSHIEEKKDEIFINKEEPIVVNEIKEDPFVNVDDPFLENKSTELVFDNVDPFLDDNDIKKEEEHMLNMPKIDNIGSVKPTSKLKEIEKINEEDNNIVLPTMGLTGDISNNINISSENYLNNNGTANI